MHSNEAYKERIKQKREELEKQRSAATSVSHRSGGTANTLPSNIHEMRSAINAERTTISHCPRTITGLRMRVSGTANAGTALIILNPLRAFASVFSVFEFECNSVDARLVVVGEAGLEPDQ